MARSPKTSQFEEWSRQLAETGVVELVAGREVVARVDLEGVLLPGRDLRVRWQHLGFADGRQSSRSSWFSRSATGTLALSVSRPWWAAHIAGSTGEERDRAERELANGWATPTVSFRARTDPPVEVFAEWLSAEAITRAPIPERFYLSPAAETSVYDRDTNRPVPVDRLPVGPELRDRIAAWGAASAEMSGAAALDESAWARFLPEGRAIAVSMQEVTGLPTAVWEDCPELP